MKTREDLACRKNKNMFEYVLILMQTFFYHLVFMQVDVEFVKRVKLRRINVKHTDNIWRNVGKIALPFCQTIILYHVVTIWLIFFRKIMSAFI